MPSLQLTRYLLDRAADVPLEEAAERHGFALLEARLTDKAVAAGEIQVPELKESPMPDNIAADQLRLIVERVERLVEERKGLQDDIKDVFSEAKANGYDTKTLRVVLRRRAMEPHARQEADALLATYCAALGMQLAFDI